MGRKQCCVDICVFVVRLATQSPTSSRHTRQAGPLPPQGWRLNSKTCVHCPPPVPTRIHKKRIGTKIGAVCHAVARSSVERAFRCVRIMHLVCCVGESFVRYITLATCVTLPCSCGVRNTRCRPTKRKPEMLLLAKRCKEMYRGPRKTKLRPWFFVLLVTPLRQP